MMARAAVSTSEAECTDAVVTLKMQTDLAHRRESMYECRAAAHPVRQDLGNLAQGGGVNVDRFTGELVTDLFRSTRIGHERPRSTHDFEKYHRLFRNRITVHKANATLSISQKNAAQSKTERH